MRRNLLVVAVGLSLLILLTWLGTIITSIVPHRATPQMQTAQVGPYQITLQVNPNPPLITQPATLSLQVILNSSQQPVTNAKVTLGNVMESMDMGTDTTEARSQGNGTYLASVQFSMSGLWRVQVTIALPGAKPVSVSFDVTAQ